MCVHQSIDQKTVGNTEEMLFTPKQSLTHHMALSKQTPVSVYFLQAMLTLATTCPGFAFLRYAVAGTGAGKGVVYLGVAMQA